MLNRQQQEQQLVTVGHTITAFPKACEVKAAFGVTSIHNMPVLDAMGERGKIHFVVMRDEAGSTNMTDAYVRTIDSLGVCLTSTDAAAGDAADVMVEALVAGTPLLHITGQVETSYLDQGLAHIHEMPDQLTMLKAASRAAFRVHSTDTAISITKLVVQIALTTPAGPMSVEIPVDTQVALIPMPGDLRPLLMPRRVPFAHALDGLAERLSHARRPILWLGGGVRHAAKQVKHLMGLGFGVTTSTRGRDTVPENDPRLLGAFNLHKLVEAFYQTYDVMVVVGSCLRDNETLKYELRLSRPPYRIDTDASAEDRYYTSNYLVCGDSMFVLDGLADRLEKKMQVDTTLAADLRAAHEAVVGGLVDDLGSYVELVEVLQAAVGCEFNWARDMTVSNSTRGNRQLRTSDLYIGVYTLGGDVSQSLVTGIDAAINTAATGSGKATFCLAGDGGFTLNLSELAITVQERASLAVILMSDKDYGVIRSIQGMQYGGHRHYVDLYTLDCAAFVQSLQLRHRRVPDLANVGSALKKATSGEDLSLMEIDMLSIDSFKMIFVDPPVNQQAKDDRGERAAVCATSGTTVVA